MALLASPASVGAAAVGVRQGLLLFVGGAAMLWMPIGLSVALLVVVVGSWVAGAWWWAVQLSEPIPRSLVRQVSLAVGVGWGMGVGLACLGLGLQPGQLDRTSSPWPGPVGLERVQWVSHEERAHEHRVDPEADL